MTVDSVEERLSLIEDELLMLRHTIQTCTRSLLLVLAADGDKPEDRRQAFSDALDCLEDC